MTMQLFYNRLFTTRHPLWAALAKLAQATQSQLAGLDLGWYTW